MPSWSTPSGRKRSPHPSTPMPTRKQRTSMPVDRAMPNWPPNCGDGIGWIWIYQASRAYFKSTDWLAADEPRLLVWSWRDSCCPRSATRNSATRMSGQSYSAGGCQKRPLAYELYRAPSHGRPRSNVCYRASTQRPGGIESITQPSLSISATSPQRTHLLLCRRSFCFRRGRWWCCRKWRRVGGRVSFDRRSARLGCGL